MLVPRARRWRGVDRVPAELPVCSAVSGAGSANSLLCLRLLSHGGLHLGKRKWGSVENATHLCFLPQQALGFLGQRA